MMAIEDPGHLTVTCDRCGVQQEMDTCSYGDGRDISFGVDEQTISDNGWEAIDDEHLCQDCVEGETDE